MTQYKSKPAQFRLPEPILSFIARESAAANVSKTEVVVRALRSYEDELCHDRLGRAYAAASEILLEEVREWDALGIDTLEGSES